MTTNQHNENEPEVVEVESSDVLATISRAEIDIQIATAKKYPRSIQAFQRDLMTFATADEDTARSMFYVLPRDGKQIEGASVRLAEAAASCWGNAHFGARIVDVGEDTITAQAVAWDMEKNVRVAIEVRRRIINRYGKRYSDDMIITTSNAAQSIAFRNAVFKIVPAALTRKAYLQAKQVSLGKEMTMEQRRKRALKAMAEVGAKAADVFRLLKRRGEDDLTVDDLINLNGLYTAIKEGDTTWAQVMAEMPKTDADLATVLDKVGDDLPDNKANPTTGEMEDRPLSPEERDEILKQIVTLGVKPKKLAAALASCDVEDIGELKVSQLEQFLQGIMQR